MYPPANGPSQGNYFLPKSHKLGKWSGQTQARLPMVQNFAIDVQNLLPPYLLCLLGDNPYNTFCVGEIGR